MSEIGQNFPNSIILSLPLLFLVAGSVCVSGPAAPQTGKQRTKLMVSTIVVSYANVYVPVA